MIAIAEHTTGRDNGEQPRTATEMFLRLSNERERATQRKDADAVAHANEQLDALFVTLDPAQQEEVMAAVHRRIRGRVIQDESGKVHTNAVRAMHWVPRTIGAVGEPLGKAVGKTAEVASGAFWYMLGGVVLGTRGALRTVCAAWKNS